VAADRHATAAAHGAVACCLGVARGATAATTFQLDGVEPEQHVAAADQAGARSKHRQAGSIVGQVMLVHVTLLYAGKPKISRRRQA
jgi:hypothetical protein